MMGDLEVTKFTGTNDKTYKAREDQIRLGQAYNNACDDARHENKMDDVRYIFQRVAFHYETITTIQKEGISGLAAVLGDDK